ncbi:CHASE2 domain-containing protein [Treponema sp.]|uniref:CHASE2 domain-containing protein n=1 Tax=Treponema sp. TaxID=166 RepID=UPI00298DF311|nr:CHASE2 domain-containing protein [Treponema sp.]MCQ2240198.1 CHASE2 domain-containing protein [Treponema sp.]
MNKTHYTVVVCFLCALIPLFSIKCYKKTFETLDRKACDIYQRFLPSTDHNKNVVMINVDDDSVGNIGTWPFSRDVYGKILESLKDENAHSVIFDLSFLDKSPAKVDEDYVTNILPSYIQSDLDNATSQIGNALSENPQEAKDRFEEILNQAKNNILISTSYVIRPLDGIFADAIKKNGNTFLNFTLNKEPLALNAEFSSDYVRLKNITVVKDDKTPEFLSVSPSLSMFVNNGVGSGFVNADPDRDGYIRRVHLVAKYNGEYYGQLVFVPILRYYGNPEVVVTNKKITLKDAKFPDGSVKDINIPRDKDGSVILKFSKTEYVKYNSIPLWNIYRLSLLEDQINNIVYQMEDAGLFGFLGDASPVEIISAMNYIKEELSNGEDAENGITYAAYLENRSRYFESLKASLGNEYESVVLAEVEGDDDLTQYVKETFASARNDFEEFYSSYEAVSKIVKDSLCIIGTSATSTTDYGLTLYEEHYPNPGVHYTLANQLISLDFLSEGSPKISVVYAILLSLIIMFVTTKLKGTLRKVILGFGISMFSIASTLVVFVVTRRYYGVVIPLSASMVTFIYFTVAGFLSESKGKKFITNAFGQCLSKEVVKEIVEHPESFKLGGQKLEMTAIFTDIQKFSSFSELLSASQLVALLNYYLTEMSDIIMSERGTVDKYEGDAIIALVGAPVKMDDHAERAVRAALKMKDAEILINQHIKDYKDKEKPENMDQDLYDAFRIMIENDKTIFTRIGINSGEMIAGYMGSENKKNYTMMGNNVNLASRLEGVNKQYSTGGILVSESTRKLLGDEFLVRRLDRVQVVNVKTPIQLYEPLGLKSGASSELLDYIDGWEKAMDFFVAGDYPKALELFLKLAQKKPDDKVAKYYVSLVSNFFLRGKYPEEQDGAGVVYNPELKAFRLLSK